MPLWIVRRSTLPAISHSASNSFNRSITGFSAITFAVLSSERVAFVSSRRRMMLASASFSAVTTLLRMSRISPGRITSLTAISPTETPIVAMSVRTRSTASISAVTLSARISSRFLRAQRLAERELQRAVERIGEVLDRGRGLDRIDDLVLGRDVDAQRDAVAGQDLLAGDVDRLAAQVDDLDRRLAGHRPEHVRTRRQQAQVGAVGKQQADMALADIDRRGQTRLDQRGKTLGQRGRHGQVVGHRDGSDGPGTGVRPEHRTLIRLQRRMELAVAIDQHDLVGAGAELGRGAPWRPPDVPGSSALS